MEVIYTGLHQPVKSIFNQALQEDVDVIGLSIMSGAHIPICRKLMDLIHEEGLDGILVVVGGVIPNRDFPLLGEMGIQGIFPGGSRFEDICRFIEENTRRSIPPDSSK